MQLFNLFNCRWFFIYITFIPLSMLSSSLQLQGLPEQRTFKYFWQQWSPSQCIHVVCYCVPPPHNSWWMSMKLKLHHQKNATVSAVFYPFSLKEFIWPWSFQQLVIGKLIAKGVGCLTKWTLTINVDLFPSFLLSFFLSFLIYLGEHFRLQGNPLCTMTNFIQFCGAENNDGDKWQGATNSTQGCPPQACPPPYEYLSLSPGPCLCSAPLFVGYRLKSPGFAYFEPYMSNFEEYLSTGLSIYPYQLQISSILWQKGPRLSMYLKIFPVYDNNSRIFNQSELQRIRTMFTGWGIADSDLFGPYELLNFTLLGPYEQGLSRTRGFCSSLNIFWVKCSWYNCKSFCPSCRDN